MKNTWKRYSMQAYQIIDKEILSGNNQALIPHTV